MGVETSPSFTFSGAASTPTDPDADLKLSPLWPLQSALRSGFIAATNNASTTPDQTAVVITPRNEVETMFGQWRNYTSLTKLRSSILYAISPPYLDLANDPALSAFQAQLLALPQWNDALPS